MIFEEMGNDLPGNRIWERVGNNKGGDGKCPGIQQEYGSLGGVGSNLLFEGVNYPSVGKKIQIYALLNLSLSIITLLVMYWL